MTSFWELLSFLLDALTCFELKRPEFTCNLQLQSTVSILTIRNTGKRAARNLKVSGVINHGRNKTYCLLFGKGSKKLKTIFIKTAKANHNFPIKINVPSQVHRQEGFKICLTIEYQLIYFFLITRNYIYKTEINDFLNLELF
ncbi:Uncharacterised protein [Legionella busanensis]|uniref:Uncharacterized protein n=1 Tax=Legionella busanensis TaxID=190655 RepID=A0A378KIR2_9GAMM|nr:hypothetical protein [Legionella busanensis]STX81684.1 Uncharacterised protein [Legionella busanensis]